MIFFSIFLTQFISFPTRSVTLWHKTCRCEPIRWFFILKRLLVEIKKKKTRVCEIEKVSFFCSKREEKDGNCYKLFVLLFHYWIIQSFQFCVHLVINVAIELSIKWNIKETHTHKKREYNFRQLTKYRINKYKI